MQPILHQCRTKGMHGIQAFFTYIILGNTGGWYILKEEMYYKGLPQRKKKGNCFPKLAKRGVAAPYIITC